MKKINLSKFALSIVVLVSFNSLATTYQTEDRICPIGGKKFTVEALMSYSTYGKRLDLKPLGRDPSTIPQPLIVCPNGFVDYKKDYSEAEIISFTKLINSPSYQRLRSGNTDYFMLAQMLESMGAGKLIVGWTYLEASWEAESRYSNHHHKYVPYLNSAIHNFNLAVDESDDEIGFAYRFLIVELNRLKGDFISAKLKLEELESNIVPLDYEIVLVDFMKELIDSLNAEPQRLPKP
tara:strand:- start:42 stop:749 length:708 start_codon:yes stop_codon:yes gene_type:complete